MCGVWRNVLASLCRPFLFSLSACRTRQTCRRCSPIAHSCHRMALTHSPTIPAMSSTRPASTPPASAPPSPAAPAPDSGVALHSWSRLAHTDSTAWSRIHTRSRRWRSVERIRMRSSRRQKYSHSRIRHPPVLQRKRMWGECVGECAGECGGEEEEWSGGVDPLLASSGACVCEWPLISLTLPHSPAASHALKRVMSCVRRASLSRRAVSHGLSGVGVDMGNSSGDATRLATADCTGDGDGWAEWSALSGVVELASLCCVASVCD